MGAQYKEGRKKILAAFSKTVSPSFHVTLFASLRRVSRLSIKCRPCPLYLCVCVCQCSDGRQTGAPMLPTRISSFKITISVILGSFSVQVSHPCTRTRCRQTTDWRRYVTRHRRTLTARNNNNNNNDVTHYYSCCINPFPFQQFHLFPDNLFYYNIVDTFLRLGTRQILKENPSRHSLVCCVSSFYFTNWHIQNTLRTSCSS